MAIDSSAILAILFGAPEARRIALALTRAEERLISAATMIKTKVAIIFRGHSEGVRERDLRFAKIVPEIAAVIASPTRSRKRRVNQSCQPE